MSSTHLRREVVTHPAIFEPYNRPYVIVSETPNPEYPDQHIAVGISTNDATDSIPIGENDWQVGSLSKESYILPRYPTVISERNTAQTVGALTPDIVDEAARSLARTVGVDLE
ncbi:hypothetical protein [Halosimplex halobium]|uniref:hypothetical protein n=1 Tax=Halosimplex halobium TaxID=3396618 RepID=UPI003F57CA26